jgi:hypothetical protein
VLLFCVFEGFCVNWNLVGGFIGVLSGSMHMGGDCGARSGIEDELFGGDSLL